MGIQIALLRGINVGGRNIVPMAQLRESLGAMGLGDVRTYIQSGNVVFESGRAPGRRLVADMQKAIEKDFGCAPAIRLLSAEALTKAVDGNPFADRDGAEKSVHLMFLASAPDETSLARAEALAADSEDCALRGDVFYLYAPHGVGRSKLLKGAEKALGVEATARNLRTVRKILALATG